MFIESGRTDKFFTLKMNLKKVVYDRIFVVTIMPEKN